MIAILPFLEEDYQQLIDWVKNEEFLMQFAGSNLHYPLTKEQITADLQDKNRIAFKAIDTLNNKTIGHGQLYVKHDSFKLLRILIGDENYKNKGYGEQLVKLLLDYGFKNLHKEKAELNVYEWNTPALKCYKKVGFKVNQSIKRTDTLNGKTWWALNMVYYK